MLTTLDTRSVFTSWISSSVTTIRVPKVWQRLPKVVLRNVAVTRLIVSIERRPLL